MVTLPHSAQRKHEFFVKTKEKDKSKKGTPNKKVAMELLHHRLGHISTKSLMTGDNASFWHDIELRIHPYHFCKSCQIFPMN